MQNDIPAIRVGVGELMTFIKLVRQCPQPRNSFREFLYDINSKAGIEKLATPVVIKEDIVIRQHLHMG